MKFTEYLTESKEGKNLHLEHLEDNVLNSGVAGARESINFLQSLRDMLAGKAQSHVNVTTKWDGAPSIFVGTNPENGKFFVGTKSVFNKNAKLNYTDEDIVNVFFSHAVGLASSASCRWMDARYTSLGRAPKCARIAHSSA
jgi:hypothetical protein